MAGIILSLAVVVAITAMVQTGIGLVGALVFPVGFVILSVMGYDLVTGVFGLAPLAKSSTTAHHLGPYSTLLGTCWVSNLGSLYRGFPSCSFIDRQLSDPNAVAAKFVAVSTARSLGFENMGMDGWITCFVRGTSVT